ncbi:hypothetical protein IMY05_005G0165200 [Salix suchowensis]|nr:hypothetical protein IMY05_005G0165200 [Salix suchowensis]
MTILHRLQTQNVGIPCYKYIVALYIVSLRIMCYMLRQLSLPAYILQLDPDKPDGDSKCIPTSPVTRDVRSRNFEDTDLVLLLKHKHNFGGAFQPRDLNVSAEELVFNLINKNAIAVKGKEGTGNILKCLYSGLGNRSDGALNLIGFQKQ